jgi:glycosyltransferase involved in cell wall biosynthesis
VKVGLNLMFLVDAAGGAGRYAEELVPALLDADPTIRLSVFVNRDAPASLAGAAWAGEVDWVRFPTRFSNRTHLLGQATALPAVAARRRLDVVHSLANGGPPLTLGAKRVVTLLDLIWLHQREAWGTPAAVRTMAILTRVSARTAHRVITISESARDDIVRSFGLDGESVDVAPLGVRPPERPLERAVDAAAPLVLCVAQKRPYKNLATLIHAVAELRDVGVELVLPGAPTEHEAELRALAGRLEVADSVRFPAWVSDEELERLYARATCFVLPSLIEGFGLPVLEAMARGVPVACSDRPALPEIAGDAALLFDPVDQAAVTEAVRRLVTDEKLRDDLAERGRRRARLFSWRRTAEQTLASYRRAVGE